MSLSGEEAGRLRPVLPFAADAAEVRALRGAVGAVLARWGATAAADEVELAVMELAANVVKHVGEGAAATLILEAGGDRLRIEMHDKGRSSSALGEKRVEAERGRGLCLIAAMSEEWGVMPTAAGKAVWCELSTESAGRRVRVQRGAMVLDEYRRLARASSVAAPTAAVLEEAVTDVIADLLHWLTAQGGDPGQALYRAQMHFEAESDVV
ncbi:ATP-binding protein [Streptomyces spectabilis]|uniref:ATP-binding protein n=1 Tax=Streptomyces spectabilis TaxID=68270 RepID=A0A516R802_STRST|nr:ATP-binding protein [Streptomyces spectabilis]QDQ11765.1 ATP-binding protein [Streptomyces spectabilis]